MGPTSGTAAYDSAYSWVLSFPLSDGRIREVISLSLRNACHSTDNRGGSACENGVSSPNDDPHVRNYLQREQPQTLVALAYEERWMLGILRAHHLRMKKSYHEVDDNYRQRCQVQKLSRCLSNTWRSEAEQDIDSPSDLPRHPVAQFATHDTKAAPQPTREEGQMLQQYLHLPQ